MHRPIADEDLAPLRLIDELDVGPLRFTGSAPMPINVLAEALLTSPRTQFGLDLSRMREIPVRFGYTLDRVRHSYRIVCQRCSRPPALVYGDGVDGIVRRMDATLDMDQRRYIVEGWLVLDVYLGQCRGCGRIYWR